MIKRADLYIIGYRFNSKWYHFWDSDLMLDGSIRASEYLAYENDICSELGANSLRYGVELMNYPDSKSRKRGCEIFYVHISESARFLPIQSLICQGFLRGGLVDFESPILSETTLFEWAEGTAEEIDVVCYAYASRKPDFFKFKDAFDYMGNLVRNGECLSKAWATYCLLETQDLFQTLDVTLSQCRIRNVHSLRNVLGLLANQKLEELRTLIVDDPALDAEENHQRRVNRRAKIDSWTQDRNRNVVATKKVELSGKKGR